MEYEQAEKGGMEWAPANEKKGRDAKEIDRNGNKSGTQKKK